MSANRNERQYPRTGRLLFDGGLNSKFHRILLPDNESPDCKNVIFDNGAVETRGGTGKLNTTSVGTFVGDGCYVRHDSDGSETMCAFWNGTLYTLGGTSFTTLPSAQSIWTANNRVCATEYEDYLFMGNGGTIPYKYNGTDFTRHGIYPPVMSGVSAISATTGAGTITGDIQYKFTYVNTNLVEGDVSTATATLAVASGQVILSEIPLGPQSYGVAYRRIYRAASGGTFCRVATLADNTTTSYVDNTTPSALGTNAPSDVGLPPNYSTIVYHQSRLFCNDPSNPNFVKYSELANPYSFPSTNFIRVGDKSGDIVQALAVYGDSVLVFCKRSTWMIYMPSTTASEWRQVRIKSPYGSKCPFGIENYNNKTFFPAFQNDKIVGFAAISGDTVNPNVTFLTVNASGSDLISDRIEADVFDIQSTYVKNISSIVYKNKVYVAVTHGSGATTNNRIYVYDFSISNLSKKQEGSWCPWTGINVSQFAVYNGTLYGQGTADGYVYELNKSIYEDSGAAIDSYYWTKEFAGQPGHESIFKDFRFANIFYELAGAYYMGFAFRTDSDSGDGTTKQINLDPGGNLWGDLEWGTDLWGGGNSEDETEKSLGTARGKRIQFRFDNQNTSGQKFKIPGLSFTYILKGKR